MIARFRVEIVLLVVAISWGSTYAVAKDAVTPGTVVALLAVRMILAAAALIVVLAVRRVRVTAREFTTGLILGTILSGIFALETFGIATTSATNVGVIISLAMVFTPILDALVSRRRIPRAILAASAVAVVGVVLLASGGSLAPPTLGDLLVVGAAALRAVHVTTIHRLSAGTQLDSLTLTGVQLAVCAAVFTAASCVVSPLPDYVLSLSAAAAVQILYLALVCTVFAFFAQVWAIRRTSPTRVSLLLGTEPIWAVLLGALIAHDTLGPVAWAGAVIVLGAVLWGTVEDQRRVTAPAR